MNDLAAPTLESAAPPVVSLDQPGTDDVSMNDLIDGLVKTHVGDEPAAEGDVAPAAKGDETTEEEPVVDEDDGKDDDADERRKKALSKDGKLDDEKVGKAFAKLRDQERRAKARAVSQEADRKALLAGRAEYDERVKAFNEKYEPLYELATKNPVQYLQKAGWTKQQIADFIVNDEKLPPERLIAEADERVRAQVEDLDRRQRELDESIGRERVQGKAREYENLVDTQVRGMAAEHPLTMKMARVDAEKTKSDPHSVMKKAVLNYIATDYKRQQAEGVQNPRALAPRQALAYFEQRLAHQKQILMDENPGQAGAGKTAANPGAGQPRPLTNDASAVRGATVHSGDDEQDEAVRQRAFDKLLADAERGVFPDE